MAQQIEYDEEEFQQSGAGWWIRLIGIIAYGMLIVAYATQTLQLVQWLIRDGNWFMQIITMFVCDGCATGYAMAEMFYRFRLRRSKHLTFGMWIVTFVLSTAATVIQMYLSSTHNIPHAIDPSIITIAYGLIIIAFVVNIIAITVIIRMEYGAALPTRRYLDDKPKTKKARPQQQPAQLSQTDHVSPTVTSETEFVSELRPEAMAQPVTFADLAPLVDSMNEITTMVRQLASKQDGPITDHLPVPNGGAADDPLA